MDIGIHTRKNRNLVVTIGASGGGGIPIKVASARVRRRAAHIRIAKVLRSVVEVVPAGNIRTHRAGARGHILEAIAVGQAVDISTKCTDTTVDIHTDTIRTFFGNTVVVQGVGYKVLESIECVGHVDDSVRAQVYGEAVATVSSPADSNLVETGTGCRITWDITPLIGQEDVVNSQITG